MGGTQSDLRMIWLLGMLKLANYMYMAEYFTMLKNVKMKQVSVKLAYYFYHWPLKGHWQARTKGVLQNIWQQKSGYNDSTIGHV